MINTLKIPPSDGKKHLSLFLHSKGIFPASPCGGRGACGKCKIKVLQGDFISHVTGERLIPDENGFILSCLALCPKDGGVITIPSEEELSSYKTNSNRNGVTSYVGDVNVALDLGTTTLAMKFLSPEKESLCEVSLLNPQKAFGSDVITRIEKSRESLFEMQDCVLSEVRKAAAEFLRFSPNAFLKKLTVAGNPTMLHIFCGISPEALGVYPFTPVFTETKTLSGEDINLPFDEIILLPSASAFIGSDVLCGALVCDMLSLETPSLLIDLGTNGEIILCGNGRLIAASTAAGPALEGANISCGIGGVTGGISKITQTGGGLVFETVNDGHPVGLCGSGLVDLVTCLLDDGTIDETGYMETPFHISGMHKTAKGITDVVMTPVSLTPKDVREFQVAKSAVRAGIEILLNASELSYNDIGQVFLTGGLNAHINIISAIRTGIFPCEFAGKITSVGNTALKGSEMCLAECSLKELSAIADCCETLELNSIPEFPSLFAQYMMFEKRD